MTRRLGRIVFFLAAAVAAAIAVLWLRSWEPADREAVAVDCRADTPAWSAERPLRVMSYNVQYMAGKDYVFFYDIDPRDEVRLAALTESGKELTDYPSREVVVRTLQQVADVILDEDPDIVLLQEINGAGDGRTHFVDQVAELRSSACPRSATDAMPAPRIGRPNSSPTRMF